MFVEHVLWPTKEMTIEWNGNCVVRRIIIAKLRTNIAGYAHMLYCHLLVGTLVTAICERRAMVRGGALL